jgi:hypothetical protein
MGLTKYLYKMMDQEIILKYGCTGLINLQISVSKYETAGKTAETNAAIDATRIQ